jgi:hypothetical protein
MKGVHTCPRCRSTVRAPNMWSNAWRCDTHGEVHPVGPPRLPSPEHLQQIKRSARVPVWVPWPLPPGWLVTGATCAGDELTGARATVLACTGPNRLGGVGEMIIVAEEPGIGLGAGYAGIDGPDPGADMVDSPCQAKIYAAGHPTPLWWIDAGENRSAYVGAAGGFWLWTVLWPESADLLMLDGLTLLDARDARLELDLPLGALSPRL